VAAELNQPNAGRWTHRLAVGAALAAIPLVIFGGSVTTLGAGMAVDGWLVAEGHFLLFFPVEAWFRDLPTFIEHTHRLFGALVGLLALLSFASAMRIGARGVQRILPAVALLAVIGQGAIGGLRVLEASPELAFLHGAVAQVVFAILCASAWVSSPRWSQQAPEQPTGNTSPRLPLALAGLTLALVVMQTTLGAWLRHGMRPGDYSAVAQDVGLRFALHVGGAILVTLLLMALAARLKGLGSSATPTLRRAPGRLIGLLAVQALLGFAAWSGFRPDSVGPAEWIVSVAHVLVSALLLAQCTGVVMWLRRAGPVEAMTPAPVALGAAR